MTRCNRSDVVLVNFMFSDETGTKKRPGIVISTNEYNHNRDEVIIAAVTSRTNRLMHGDYLITDWKGAGLLAPSVATAIYRTIKQDMIAQKVGTIQRGDAVEIGKKVKYVLGLS